MARLWWLSEGSRSLTKRVRRFQHRSLDFNIWSCELRLRNRTAALTRRRMAEHRKRHAGDLYSGDSVNFIGSAYDIYERGISDLENGPPRAGAHAAGPARGFAGRF